MSSLFPFWSGAGPVPEREFCAQGRPGSLGQSCQEGVTVCAASHLIAFVLSWLLLEAPAGKQEDAGSCLRHF